MSSEIRWGSRFKPCVKYTKTGYYVDHKLFNDMEEVLTPLCSARRLEEVLCETYFNKGPEGIYTPRTVYSPILSDDAEWPPEIDEADEDHEYLNQQEFSSGIGSSVVSPESTRSNKTLAVAEIHRQPTTISVADRNRNEITTTNHSSSDDDSDRSEEEEGEGIRFVYMEERDSSCSDSDEKNGNQENVLDYINEVDENHSPYARRKPFFSARKIKPTPGAKSEGSKRNSETLFSSLQNYTTNFFTRQTSKDVTETDL